MTKRSVRKNGLTKRYLPRLVLIIVRFYWMVGWRVKPLYAFLFGAINICYLYLSKKKSKMPFIFDNMWLKVEGLKYLVWKWWESYYFDWLVEKPLYYGFVWLIKKRQKGLCDLIWATKLKALKHGLKAWNWEDLRMLPSVEKQLWMELISRVQMKQNLFFNRRRGA